MASEDSEILTETAPPWTIARVVGYSILVVVVFFAVQTVATSILLVVQLVNDPELDIELWAAGAESNGLLLSVATVFSALICFPLVKYLTGRRETDPWHFLFFRPTDLRSIRFWLVALLAFVIASDALNVAIGRPLVPEFMLDVYLTSHPVLLFLALVFAGPLFEEIFFRGFLLGGLESSGVSRISAAVVSSIVWAAIHTQYDAFNLATIFLMGLLLATARTKTNSLVPCMAMHSLANLIAFSETVLIA